MIPSHQIDEKNQLQSQVYSLINYIDRNIRHFIHI